jgi:hypothetical protein
MVLDTIKQNIKVFLKDFSMCANNQSLSHFVKTLSPVLSLSVILLVPGIMVL